MSSVSKNNAASSVTPNAATPHRSARSAAIRRDNSASSRRTIATAPSHTCNPSSDCHDNGSQRTAVTCARSSASASTSHESASSRSQASDSSERIMDRRPAAMDDNAAMPPAHANEERGIARRPFAGTTAAIGWRPVRQGVATQPSDLRLASHRQLPRYRPLRVNATLAPSRYP
jgi:hypothetical protein